jgi:hypothetical protein
VGVLAYTFTYVRAEELPAPCKGCVAELPPGRQDAVPLLVVLHGDREVARTWHARWRGPAFERGWAVLALQCPEHLGCRAGCWYCWNGSPRWIRTQVDRLARKGHIDRERIVLVGWSGGASYLGLHADAWRAFAAIVFHGGGTPPPHGRCKRTAARAYFLVGEDNVYYDAAKDLRQYLRRCRSTIVWDELADADHEDEAVALDAQKADSILAWIDQGFR